MQLRGRLEAHRFVIKFKFPVFRKIVPDFFLGEGASVHRVENRIGTLHSILLASLQQL